MSTANIIKTLWDATNLTSLSDEQLEALSCGEEIRGDLSRLAGVMSGLACLVANDTPTGAGNFQNKEDVSEMLWGFASAINVCAEAVEVSNFAAIALKNRALGTHSAYFGESKKMEGVQS